MKITTSDATIELELDGEAVTARICDADGAQRTEELGGIDNLEDVLVEVITEAARDLASSLVADLTRRAAEARV